MSDRPPLEELPVIYATVLGLRDAGLSDDAIATRLEIAPEAIDPLIRAADAKAQAVSRRLDDAPTAARPQPP